ncbi:MAG: hypothetical protein ACT6T3_22255, partial [Agrobacterium sp.]|uniref:hypothetical protein n=1 Tax=Agrobacterium sp. TaxID=361 RepID=UPI00403457D5
CMECDDRTFVTHAAKTVIAAHGNMTSRRDPSSAHHPPHRLLLLLLLVVVVVGVGVGVQAG